MQTLRILYLRDNVLEQAEEVQLRDVLDAIELASAKAADLRAEVWSEDKRVGEIDAVPVS